VENEAKGTIKISSIEDKGPDTVTLVHIVFESVKFADAFVNEYNRATMDPIQYGNEWFGPWTILCKRLSDTPKWTLQALPEILPPPPPPPRRKQARNPRGDESMVHMNFNTDIPPAKKR